MNFLEIDKKYIEDFESNQKVYIFDRKGENYSVKKDTKIEEKMKEIEKKYNCTVYAIIHDFDLILEYYYFLIITNRQGENINAEYQGVKTAFAYIYVINSSWCDSIDTILVKSDISGGLKKV